MNSRGEANQYPSQDQALYIRAVQGGIEFFTFSHPGLPGVLRRFETALLHPRVHPRRGIISGGLLPSHALPPAIY
jgi:hypothetical protein